MVRDLSSDLSSRVDVDLTDEQWEVLEPLIPDRPRRANRRGRLWRRTSRTGAASTFPSASSTAPAWGRKGEGTVGKTKRSWRCQTLLVSLAACAPSASPHEVTLVEEVLAASFVREWPERLIGDRAYDSDPLDAGLRQKGPEMIAPRQREEAREPGRAQAQALQDLQDLQEALEDRAALRLATELQEAGSALRETSRELPRLCTSRVHRYPAEVFVR